MRAAVPEDLQHLDLVAGLGGLGDREPDVVDALVDGPGRDGEQEDGKRQADDGRQAQVGDIGDSYRWMKARWLRRIQAGSRPAA